MIDPVVLPGFIGACLVICTVPGPDHAYISAVALQHGRRAGVLASLGMATGMLVHLGTTVIGLGTLLRRYPDSLDIIRVLGACYLLYLAYSAVKTASALRSGETEDTHAPGATTVRQSIVINVTNPKIILFMIGFLPNFVREGVGPAWVQLLTLGLILVAIGFIVDCVVGVLVGTLSSAQTSARAHWLNFAAAVVYFSLATYLVYEALLK